MQVLEGFLFVYNLCPKVPAGIEIEFVDFEWFWNIPSVMWIGVDLHLYFWGIEWNWSFRVEFYRDDVYKTKKICELVCLQMVSKWFVNEETP